MDPNFIKLLMAYNQGYRPQPVQGMSAQTQMPLLASMMQGGGGGFSGLASMKVGLVGDSLQGSLGCFGATRIGQHRFGHIDQGLAPFVPREERIPYLGVVAHAVLGSCPRG